MKRTIVMGIVYLGIAVLGLVLVYGMIFDIKKTSETKNTSNQVTSEKLQVTKEEKEVLNPNRILDLIYDQKYSEAEQYFNNEIPEWRNFESSEQLIRFFDYYFELRYALQKCIDLNKSVEDVNREIKNLKEKNKTSKKYTETDFENNYLNGTAVLLRGIDNFANCISILEKYMDKTSRAHIPVFNIIEKLVFYENLKKVDTKNFIGLLQNYENYVIINRHDKELTQNDATVLCLKEYYMMCDAKEKNDDTRKANATNVTNDINRLQDEYSDYIGSKGSLTEYRDYLNNVYDYATKFNNNAGTKEIKSLIKNMDKVIGKDKIPGLYTEGTKK